MALAITVEARKKALRSDHAPGYEKYLKVAATAIAIRPATQNEVLNWLRTHGEDALFAESCTIGDKTMKVVRTINGFRLE